jgi:hypothetical protein
LGITVFHEALPYETSSEFSDHDQGNALVDPDDTLSKPPLKFIEIARILSVAV